jgi:transposase InsO family protein
VLLTLLSWLQALAVLASRLAWVRKVALALGLRIRRVPTYYRRPEPSPQIRRHRLAKPEWVHNEVLRLKALMADAGCRSIADTFNRLYANVAMSVGKTFVSELIRKHKHAIEVLRRKIKNAKPRPMPKNLVWGMDLTGKTTLDGRTQLVLGILEHASRAPLYLEAIESKSSWRLITKLVETVKRYGKPRIVRTDNEAVFTSRLFRFALFLLGIRHHRIEQAAPWQNGRIERLFATLKEKLDQLAVDSFEALNGALGEFRFFYNHVRPHQNLAALTPAEAWAGQDAFAQPAKNVYWFEAWDGLLSGYYLRR